MTGDPILDLVVSLAGVGALVGLAFLLGATKTLVVDEAAARERLAFDEPDFCPGDWLIDGRGRSAVSLSADRAEAAVVFGVGDGLATRRFRIGGAPTAFDGRRLVIRLDDISKSLVAVDTKGDSHAARIAAHLSARPPGAIDLSSSHAIS